MIRKDYDPAVQESINQSIQEQLNKQAGITFLEENKLRDGVVVTPSGLQYMIMKKGTGKKPTSGSHVKVHYIGSLIDGTIFDSSVERGEPVTFDLGQIIDGLKEGIQLMPLGSKFKFFIPQELAYGEREVGTIPSYSCLIFEVELLEIESIKSSKNITAKKEPLKRLPNASENKTFKIENVSFSMVYIEGGKFMMGEKKVSPPVHEVELSSFYIGETEVTQALWEVVIGTTLRQQRSKYSNDYASKDNNQPNYPMTQINWEECRDFCKRLNLLLSEQIQEWTFEIPTEAQWEYAARGGKYSHGYTYSGSNNCREVGWTNLSGGQDHIRPVKGKKPNEVGAYDMSGNVQEWCYDWWATTYESSKRKDPQGPSSGIGHVVRGGAWFQHGSGEVYHRTYELDYNGKPADGNSYTGLRVVLIKK